MEQPRGGGALPLGYIGLSGQQVHQLDKDLQPRGSEQEPGKALLCRHSSLHLIDLVVGLDDSTSGRLPNSREMWTAALEE